MASSKIHVYFVPGMAAGAEIFRNISLPTEHFTMHILEWLIPEKKETIAAYAKRMAALIVEKDAVLIGVSFGGVVAQEMSEYVALRKLIIISSVKTKDELPRRMKFARKSFFYKLIPTSLVLSAEDLTKFSVGPKSEKRLKLYQEYLHVRDKQYLDWAIQNMVCWNRKIPVEGVHHIHGNRDIVFPIRHIKNCDILDGGTHIMVLTNGQELSKRIKAIIENN